MKNYTKNKFNTFKENPFGQFNITIDMIEKNNCDEAKAFIPQLLIIKRQLIFAYAQALYDNNLMNCEEYTTIKDEITSKMSLMDELKKGDITTPTKI